jgi:hypothetical protein
MSDQFRHGDWSNRGRELSKVRVRKRGLIPPRPHRRRGVYANRKSATKAIETDVRADGPE